MFLEIIKSFIFPKKMKKYRYMSGLVAIMIFLAAIYLVTLPYVSLLKRQKDIYLQNKIYVSAYYDMDDLYNSGITDIKSANYKIVNGKMTTSRQDSDILIYEYNYNYKEENITTYLVFDVKSQTTNAIIKLRDEYLEIYEDASTTFALQVADIVYIKLQKDSSLDKNALFAECSQWTTEKMKEEISQYNNFDIFNITIADENSYLIVFFEDSFYSQIPYMENEEMTYSSYAIGYEGGNIELDFSDIDSINDIGRRICYGMFNALSSADKASNLLQALGYVLLYPIVLVMLMWLAMRKRGNMKTFKEYYNIAAISAVIPILITFVCSWFFPGAVLIFGILFSANALFSFIAINSRAELID